MNQPLTKQGARDSMRVAIQDIAVGPNRGRDISPELAQQVMGAILEGWIDDIQTAVFLIALRMKRESIGEFQGLFNALQGAAHAVTANVDQVICLADPFDGYVRTATISPFIPAVLAACGLNAVIHGVETVGPKHGVTAHKVYKLAGAEVLTSSVNAANNVADIGWAYVDQSQYAPSFYALQGLRDQIVKRTALTTLERILAPIRGRLKTHLVLGYVHKAYPEIYATVAKAAKYDSTLLLKGVEGGLAPALNKPLRRFFFDNELPDDINAEKQIIESQALFDSSSAAANLVSELDSVAQCLELGLAVLNGDKGCARDSLCLSAGQILFSHDANLTLSGAVEKVQRCLDNGSAKQRFNAILG